MFCRLSAFVKLASIDKGFKSKKAKSYTDRLGNNVRTIVAEDTADETIIDYTYDILGRVIGVVNPVGQATINEYDTFGRIIKDINPYDSSNLPTKKYEYTFDGIAPEIIKVSQKITSNNTIDVYDT